MSPHRMRRAAAVIAAGGVIAYPTEAVYGLGCDPCDGAAVRRLLRLKRRHPSKGLILIAADFSQLAPFVRPLAPARMEEIFASWPGPNTWLLPARAETPAWLTGRHRTLAVRVTAHAVAAALCRRFGGAIVSTSANLSDRPPARSALAVRRGLAQPPDWILVGECGGAERPSRIRDGASGRTLRV